MGFQYVKNNIGYQFQNIPSTYKQNFRYEFSVTGVSKNEIIRLRNDGKLTDRDVEIAKFLFTHTFATAEQIGDYLDGQGERIRNRLEHLVKLRVLNSFFLAEVDMKINTPLRDALTIYCLDFGGKYLVSRYGGMDTSDWYSTVNMKGADLIAKDLIATEFFVNLHKSSGSLLFHYTARPQMRAGRTHISPAFEFGLNASLLRKYLVGEIVFDGEEAITFRERVQKLESLLNTNAWRKYYVDVEEPPFLIILAENDVVARNAASVVNRATEIENKKVLLTTIDRMHTPLYEKGAFLIYDPETNKLRNVIVNTFRPLEA